MTDHDDTSETEPGEEWRSYVAWVQQTLADLDAEDIVVSKEAKLRPALGRDIVRFDIFYSFKKLGVQHRVAIECKAIRRGAEAADLREFAGRLQKVPGVIGVVASKYGFQSGCREEAERNGLLLLKPEDVPNLLQMVAMLLSAAILPEENTIGDPFWTLMPAKGSAVLGEYQQVPTPLGVFVPLFVSRGQAQRYLDATSIDDCVVRGLTQRMLMTMLRFSRLREDRPSFDVAVLVEHDRKYIIVPYSPDTAWSDFTRASKPFPDRAT